MVKKEYVTKEGLRKLRDELLKLETLDRHKISKKIAEARDKGDLSENAEYDAAKEAQGIIEMRISRLKEIISNVRVISSAKIDTTKVSILSTVKIRNINKGISQSYTLVPDRDTDLSVGKISVNTPIAQGLLGKKVGEISHISLPNGNKLSLEILKIYF
ncbi:transcription elongation factor GreA [Candidatus Uzinura diaspidicola str. ASNER]|uniref:Transcription elongation factor GreA n=1 Tax=Candidatus Uzinura diaspidicola str. ASNER TaxID=1133592 RepID=L7VK13_9FLAO|nr:transcription elongation factor GreA [Candidatus Uzinura diaspidicola str. ASNER]